MLILNNLNLIYSPLEQFDDMLWVGYNVILESVNIYGAYVGDFEISKNVLSNLSSLTSSNLNFLALVLLGVFVYFQSKIEVYHFFFLGLVHLLTGFFLVVWFNDVVVLENATFLNTVEENLSIIPQINFTFLFDENLISFLAVFFFWGGAEEEEDEDFILEEEEGDFIEDIVAGLFISNLGKNVEDNGGLFLKVCGIFGFVLTNNLMGMLPYSDTGTSSLMLTFWVALSVFVSLLTLMIRKHGISYFFSLFMPAGCPLPLIFVLVPIEFISYSFRLVSLSVRLFANMMAGHTLLKVIVGFSWSMILMGDYFLIANLFPIAILFVLTFLELGVAIIQAYIFTILTCIYLKDIFVAH